MAKKTPTLEVFRGESADDGFGLWYWRLRGKNGEIVCASEEFLTRGNAMRAARKLFSICMNADVKVVE